MKSYKKIIQKDRKQSEKKSLIRLKDKDVFYYHYDLVEPLHFKINVGLSDNSDTPKCIQTVGKNLYEGLSGSVEDKYQSSVDLTYYKRIWGGTEAGWEQLTDEQKAQYEYTFFDGDESDYFAVVNAVADGDMHPVTSNAVFEEMEPLKQNTEGKFELPNGLKMCWGKLGNWSGGSPGAGYRTATYPVTFTQKPTVILVPQTPKSSMELYVYCPNYDLDASSTTQLCCTPIWVTRSNPASNGWSSDNYQYFAIGY